VGHPPWTGLDSAEGRRYHRQEVTVRIGDGGEAIAFMYWYRGPHRGAPISGGDHRAHALTQPIYHDPRA